MIPPPTAVLFDLFHTLVHVPPPARTGAVPIPDLLGVSATEWRRHFYEEDTFGRGLGLVTDAGQAMRLVTHAIDPTVPEARIALAVEARRMRFTAALVHVDPAVVAALDRLRARGIRIGLVSDAGADDVEAWDESPLKGRLDATVFSYQLGVKKPAAAIYQRALDLLGVAAGGTIFVGDGGSDEHRGARALGMGTVLVTRLVDHWHPAVIEQRRACVDWEFDDVPSFVDAIVERAG